MLLRPMALYGPHGAETCPASPVLQQYFESHHVISTSSGMKQRPSGESTRRCSCAGRYHALTQTESILFPVNLTPLLEFSVLTGHPIRDPKKCQDATLPRAREPAGAPVPYGETALYERCDTRRPPAGTSSSNVTCPNLQPAWRLGCQEAGSLQTAWAAQAHGTEDATRPSTASGSLKRHLEPASQHGPQLPRSNKQQTGLLPS